MKKWTVAKLNKERALEISNKYSVSAFVAMLLDIRGIVDEKDIISFMSDRNFIDSPFDIKDMDKAVERIQKAIENDEKICVYGDFDVDGVTSTALLYSYLYDLGADVMFYIPSREEEGYGLNNNAITLLAQNNVKLIITVDNGIAAFNEVAYANSLGIDTVITDHHIPPEKLPQAVAVVDLHREDCKSFFKSLSGVGVAFKLVCAIEGEYADIESLLENYSDIIALGTIGDLVPLLGENRVLVKNGLRHITNADRVGISALLEEAGLINKKITAGNVSFNLAPRINAAGRLGLSKNTVSMLLTEDYEYAYEIAEELGKDNAERQEIEKQILAAINERIMSDPRIIQNRIIVLTGENWHRGVIGIVASRIKEIYSKPTIIISSDGQECRASGRSVKGFSLCDAVFSCSDLLTQYGGHPMAVGFSLKQENVDKFIDAINDYAKNFEMPIPQLELDCKLNPSQLSVTLASDLELLEPYGAGNPTPVFGLYSMKIVEITPLSGGKHLKLSLARAGSTIVALKFSTTLQEFDFEIGDTVDLAVNLGVNVYNNIESLSIIIKDIKFSDFDYEYNILSKEIFEAFCRGDDISKEEADSILPTRDEFAVVYRFLRQNAGFRRSIDTLMYRLQSDINYGKLRVILECMNELNLVRIFEGIYGCDIRLCEVESKVNLSDSLIIQKLKGAIS